MQTCIVYTYCVLTGCGSKLWNLKANGNDFWRYIMYILSTYAVFGSVRHRFKWATRVEKINIDVSKQLCNVHLPYYIFYMFNDPRSISYNMMLNIFWTLILFSYNSILAVYYTVHSTHLNSIKQLVKERFCLTRWLFSTASSKHLKIFNDRFDNSMWLVRQIHYEGL